MVIPVLIILTILLLLTIGFLITYAIIMYNRVNDLKEQGTTQSVAQKELKTTVSDLASTVKDDYEKTNKKVDTLKSSIMDLDLMMAQQSHMLMTDIDKVSSDILKHSDTIIEQEEYISEVNKRLADREMTAKSRQVCIDDICMTSGYIKGILSHSNPNDVRKRANLLAVALYNALRDPRQEDSLETKLTRHMTIVGFNGSKALHDIYNDGVLIPTILSQIGKQRKYYNAEIVMWLEKLLMTYKPANNNPKNLILIDVEREMGNGDLDPRSPLATTVGVLDPSGLFFPSSSDLVPPDAPRGQDALFDIYTESTTARSLLDQLIREKQT